jgi:hypothetical protein
MMKREVIVYEGLTKDQLYDMMAVLDENLLADIQWAAEVELMDRAYRKSLPALFKPGTMAQDP